MDGIFNGLRRMFAVGTLLAAIVVAGGWGKSVYDHSVNRASSEKPHGIPSLSGKIGVSGYSNPIEEPGHLPQINWRIIGLYSDVIVTFAPEQVQSDLRDQIGRDDVAIGETNQPATAEMQTQVPHEGLEGIVSANHIDANEDDDNFVTPVSAVQSDGNAMSSNDSRMGLDSGSSRSSLIFDLDSSDPDDGDVVSESKWQLCGFACDQRTTADGSWETMVLVPHWAIILPLVLVSTALYFVTRKRGLKYAAIIASTSNNPQVTNIDRDGVHGGLFHGWHRKMGLVTLLMSIALAGGWVRSRAVSDLLNIDVGSEWQVLFASAKDGIVCEYNRPPGGSVSATRYRTLTGQAHEKRTFLPMGRDLEFDFQIPAANVTVPGANIAVVGSSFVPMLPVADRALTLANAPLQTNMLATGNSSVVDFVGTTFEWGGIYICYSPEKKSLVIPYGCLVTPMTLLSVALFVRRRLKTDRPQSVELA